VVDDVITALTSDGMVAPSYWIDPKSGNNYMVTVQYANRWIDNMSMEDFRRTFRCAVFGPPATADQEGEGADPADQGARPATTPRATFR
jgi:hypothetical protein